MLERIFPIWGPGGKYTVSLEVTGWPDTPWIETETIFSPRVPDPWDNGRLGIL